MKFFFVLLAPVLSYVPFCINCKYFKDDVVDRKYGTCKKFPIIIIKEDYYLVTGIAKPEPDEYHYCSTARGSSRMCGEKGTGFEEKG